MLYIYKGNYSPTDNVANFLTKISNGSKNPFGAEGPWQYTHVLRIRIYDHNPPQLSIFRVLCSEKRPSFYLVPACSSSPFAQ